MRKQLHYVNFGKQVYFRLCRPCNLGGKSKGIFRSIHIHIVTKLLSTSIHGYQVKEEKKSSEFRDNNIPNHCLGEKFKKKFFWGKNKEKTNFVTSVEKNQEICSPLVKRTKTHRKMLQCYNYK